jgi:hypothetical protein
VTRPIGDMPAPCAGTNCGITRNDQEHSPECVAEHAASAAPAAQGEALTDADKMAELLKLAEQCCARIVYDLPRDLGTPRRPVDVQMLPSQFVAFADAVAALASQGEAPPPSVPTGQFDEPCSYCKGWPDAKVRHAKHLAYLWATSTRDTQRWQDLYEATERAIDAAAPPPSVTMSAATHDVLAERQRQMSVEGWIPEHDDGHDRGELARAAATYAFPDIWNILGWHAWPFDGGPKFHGERENLVRAGALILAEIERLDRAAPPPEQAAQPAPQLDMLPCAKLIVGEDGAITATLYAPGLPAGTHDVYPEPCDQAGEARPWPEAAQPAVPVGYVHADQAMDVMDLFKRLRDVVAEANAVDTLLGRPEVLIQKLVKLRDDLGQAVNGHLPFALATPPAQPAVPLTDQQLKKLFGGRQVFTVYEAARLVEAAHGIGTHVALSAPAVAAIHALATQSAQPAVPLTDGWQHLKAYGYAPGHYMNKCSTCGKVVTDVDKRAITCRPCAEARHIAIATPPAQVEQADAARPEPPLLGRWHHGEGYLCSGTLRIARADFDTNPAPAFRDAVFQWVVDELNNALAGYRAAERAARKEAPQ